MIALRKDKNQIIDVGTEDDVQETSDPETRDYLQFKAIYHRICVRKAQVWGRKGSYF